ncbi:hypothetical protein PYCCODRAFT_1436597 [Trametes coccinea BRFM310]|uniref:F-box domain-containing protein n=1 Tax=Trametes coccinea (strain BRFM310) TaxID=1353009 RepID=A0A1Y2IJR5_TRAC3|nr:hypothetical protein PYCCODRAFT_1436597 [Trametes coccinea BRFM310]
MSATVVSGLTGLPDELQVRIMCEMDPASILACREASSQLKETIDSSIEVHYHLELALSGMIDGPRPPGSACTRDRLAALRAYRAAWDAGKHPTQRVIIDLGKQKLHSESARHIVYHASHARRYGDSRRPPPTSRARCCTVTSATRQDRNPRRLESEESNLYTRSPRPHKLYV